MIHRYIVEATDEVKGFEEAIERLDREWGIEELEPCEDSISRQAVLDAIDVKAWEFCDYLISKNRNDEQKPVSHFADNLRECVREELPSVNAQPKTGYISIDDAMSVFDDFMGGEVDEDGTDTFLKMLKDKAESEE